MKEIITRTQRIWLDDSGIVYCEVLGTVMMDLDCALENVQAVKQLGNGKRVPVFVDMTKSMGATKEARAYFADAEVAKIQCACAMLVDTLLSQLIGNFFLGLNKTKFPVKLFSTEKEAKDWLKKFL